MIKILEFTERPFVLIVEEFGRILMLFVARIIEFVDLNDIFMD